MLARVRETGAAWLVVGPFAIILAFPFYWMLVTALKTDTDLYNTENVPFRFQDGSPTTRNFEFLFENTQYRTWLENTAIVGGVVVVIPLLLGGTAGSAPPRLSGRWGQSV